MDVSKILAELRAERAQLEEAILSLERLARGRGKRRGRPPSWLSPDRSSNFPGEPFTEGPRRRGRPPGSKNRSITASATTAVA